MAKAVTQLKNNPSSTNQKPLCSTLSLPCITEYVGVARLAISGIANQLGFDIEEIEDLFKISILER